MKKGLYGDTIMHFSPGERAALKVQTEKEVDQELQEALRPMNLREYFAKGPSQEHSGRQLSLDLGDWEEMFLTRKTPLSERELDEEVMWAIGLTPLSRSTRNVIFVVMVITGLFLWGAMHP